MTTDLQKTGRQTPATQYAEAPDAQLVAMFLHGRKQATVRKYSHDLRLFFDWLDGRALSSVSLPDLQDWTQTLSGSPKTVKERIATVRSFFSFLTKLGVLQLNPAALLKTPPVRETLHERILSDDELQRLLEAATEGRDRALLTFLYHSGVRVSELCDLKWKDVRFSSDSRKVDVFVYRAKTNETTKQTYGASSTVFAFLRELSDGTEAEDHVFRSSGVPDTIRSRAGQNKDGRLSESAVWRIVKASAKRAGIDSQKVSPHWLRHSCATQLVRKGVDVMKVAQWLGHKSLQTTTNYVHFVEDLDLSENFA